MEHELLEYIRKGIMLSLSLRDWPLGSVSEEVRLSMTVQGANGVRTVNRVIEAGKLETTLRETLREMAETVSRPGV